MYMFMYFSVLLVVTLSLEQTEYSISEGSANVGSVSLSVCVTLNGQIERDIPFTLVADTLQQSGI